MCTQLKVINLLVWHCHTRFVGSGSCHTCSRAPVWCCWKSKPTHTVPAWDLGVSLKYK